MRKVIFVLLVIIITGSMLFAQGLERTSSITVAADWLQPAQSSVPEPGGQPAAQEPAVSESTAPAPTPAESSQPASMPAAQADQPAAQSTQAPAQPAAQPAQPPAQPVQQKALAASVPDAGKIINANTLQFTIGEARLSAGDEGLQPKQGDLFLIITARVDNNGTDPQSISPVMVFQLADTKGNRYSPQVISTLDQQLDGNVGPGRTLSGQLRFEVPEAPDQYQLQIDASLVGAGTFPVTVLVQ